MAHIKWNEQKEKHLESKTESCQPRRKTSEVERTFQEAAQKLFWNNSFQKMNLTQYWKKKIKTEKMQATMNAPWSLEDKKIWWHISSIMQRSLWTKHNREGCILPFSKKGDLGIPKNNRGICLTPGTAKVYNNLYLNCIEKVLMKYLNRFRINCSQTRITRQIIEGERAKNLEATLLFLDFSMTSDSIHWSKMEEIRLVYGRTKETVTALMTLDKNTN